MAKKEPTESQLKEQVEAKRLEREAKLVNELNEWCNKNNCAIFPSVEVILNGKPIGITLKAL